MIYPDTNEILKKGNIENRFVLITAVALRARQIQEGSPILTKCNSNKFVTIAVNEIWEDKISYFKNKHEKHDNQDNQDNQDKK